MLSERIRDMVGSLAPTGIAKQPDIHMGVSQNWGYHFGVPIIRTIVYWGLYWGPPILGNYHIKSLTKQG